jgi:hypothetical protein
VSVRHPSLISSAGGKIGGKRLHGGTFSMARVRQLRVASSAGGSIQVGVVVRGPAAWWVIFTPASGWCGRLPRVVGGLHRAELPQPPDLSKLPEQRTLRHLVASVDLLAVRGIGGVSGGRPRCLVEQRAGFAALLIWSAASSAWT